MPKKKSNHPNLLKINKNHVKKKITSSLNKLKKKKKQQQQQQQLSCTSP